MAYERLREDILRGRHKPGDRLGIAAIAERYGTSPIPIREALRNLQAEGLVEFAPNRGAVIARLTTDDLEEIFLIRAPLEALAMERAVHRLTENDLGRLDQLITEMAQHEDEPARWLELNQRFHLLIYERAGMPRLYQVLTRLWGMVRPYLGVYMAGRDHLPQAHQEHIEMVRACRARDPETAVRILLKHLRVTAEIVAAELPTAQAHEKHHSASITDGASDVRR